MIPPIGKIKICRPGNTKGASDATTRVWMGDWTEVLVTVAFCAKTPETKFASPVARVVFTCKPFESIPVNVTVGTTVFSSIALRLLALSDSWMPIIPT